MSLTYGMHMEQSQKLIMTPELRQAIWLLQLSSVELIAEIQKQLEENMVLEINEETPSSGNDDDNSDNDMKESKESTDSVNPDDPADAFDWQKYIGENTNADELHGYNEGREKSQLQNWVASEQTLSDYLQWQLHMSVSDVCEAYIGLYIIGNIDDNGYLRLSVEEIAEELDLPIKRIEDMLTVIQGFDPPGVGARNLQECLLLQLATLENTVEMVYDLVKNHLNDIACGKITRIAETMKVTPRELQNAIDYITTLDPKPGRSYGSSAGVRYLVPDVYVEKDNDEFVVLLNDMVTPSLTINSYYQSMLRQKQLENDALKFIEGRINSAVWFIKSVEQRRMTICKVTESIVRFQRDFFERGIRHLIPLTLKQVASDIGMHESTVSRATSNKYVQTPHGLYELSFFFSSGLENLCGENISSSSVKKMIEDMVREEDNHHPHSDQKIAEILEKKGIEISRRTVAKYREEIGIASSAKRKRYN